MLHSLDCFVDPVSSGLIGILSDSTAGLLRFKCMLTLVTVSVIVSALKPIYVRQFCHKFLPALRFCEGGGLVAEASCMASTWMIEGSSLHACRCASLAALLLVLGRCHPVDVRLQSVLGTSERR